MDLLDENEEEIRLLRDLYDEHRELLDQSKLGKDLEQLHKLVGYPPCSRLLATHRKSCV